MSTVVIDVRADDDDPARRLIWLCAKLQTSPSMPTEYRAEFERLASAFKPEDMVRAVMETVTLTECRFDGDRLILATMHGCSID